MDDVPPCRWDRIKEERLRLDFETVSQLAKACKISRQRMQAIEDGRGKAPSAEELTYLANVGVDVGYVLTGQRRLRPDEEALLDNYRSASNEHRGALRQVGAAFAKPVSQEGFDDAVES